MKKILIGLAALVLVAGMGAAGYLAYTRLAVPAKPAQASSAADETSSAASQRAKEVPDVNVMKPVHSDADMLDEIAYEKTQNTDTVGWLYIPDTQISASVLQSFDNAYYLRRDERKRENIYGCYFADYACNFGTRDELSPNTIIYGHSDLKDNSDGPRFSQLFKFTDIQFATMHPDIFLATPEEVMVFQIFAVFYTDTGFAYNNAKLSGDGVLQVAQEAQSRSLYQYDAAITAEDKILTLSTCTIEYGAQEKEQRFVVMGKLMPADYVRGQPLQLTENPSPVQPVFSK